MVINLILSGSTTEVVGEWEVNTEDNVNIDDFNLAPGETRSIDVKLCNSQAYTALQFDLRLPEGLEIVSIGKADRIANHNIHSGTLPSRCRTPCWQQPATNRSSLLSLSLVWATPQVWLM